MSKINITEDDIKKLSPQLVATQSKTDEEYQKLLKDLDEIAKKYELNSTTPTHIDTEINLERKTFTAPSDDEIAKQAQDSLADFKHQSENAINQESKAKKQNLENQIETAKQTAENNRTTITNYYDQAKQSAENDALKRGLSRSSIIINTLSAFDQDRINKLNAIDKTLTSQIENLNDQIDLLNLEKQKALNDFNITYATKLNDKIASLKSELQNRYDEVTEYNNKIAQIEKEYQKDAVKQNNNADSQSFSDIIDKIKLFANNGDAITSAMEKENYTAISNFLKTLDSQTALNLLQGSSFLKKMLGNEYSALVGYFKNQG